MNDSSDILRKLAEKLLSDQSASTVESRSDKTLDLIYELNVHQVELEMQNDELRQTQEALVESKERLSELFELAPVTYLTVNSAGDVTEANSKSEELFEDKRSNIVGNPLASYCTPESADRLYLCLRKGRQKKRRITCELNLKKGLLAREVRLHAVQATNGEMQPGLLRVVITDITEQKRIAAIQAEHLNAVQHEKIRTLGIIAGGVAHDFNNLLTPIMMHAELASQCESLQPSAQNNLKCIVNAAESAAGICKSLLELAGGNQFVSQPFPISQLVSEQIEFLNTSLASNLKLVYKDTDASVNVLGEPDKVRRVLSNLLTNAIEAIGDAQGTIVVESSTKYFTKASLAKMTFAADLVAGRFACVSITDNGCGMDKQTIELAFDAFFSTKSSGRGLGMSSVIGIIREHGAAIDVSSKQDSGTSIVAVFPITDREVVSIERDSDIVSGGSGTVLVVDDNALVRETFIQLLDFSGFSTLAASSGAEAIELINNSSKQIDVVLLDLVMPEMNGVETMVAFRKIAPSMPVVIATGYAEGEMLEMLKSHVVQGFITKPCSIGILSKAVKLAIESNRKLAS